MADLIKCIDESITACGLCVFYIAHAGSENHSGIVRTRMVVDGHRVKTAIRRLAHHGSKQRGGDDGIGSEISQHRGMGRAGERHARADHPAALTDAGDGHGLLPDSDGRGC